MHVNGQVSPKPTFTFTNLFAVPVTELFARTKNKGEIALLLEVSRCGSLLDLIFHKLRNTAHAQNVVINVLKRVQDPTRRFEGVVDFIGFVQMLQASKTGLELKATKLLDQITWTVGNLERHYHSCLHLAEMNSEAANDLKILNGGLAKAEDKVWIAMIHRQFASKIKTLTPIHADGGIAVVTPKEDESVPDLSIKYSMDCINHSPHTKNSKRWLEISSLDFNIRKRQRMGSDVLTNSQSKDSSSLSQRATAMFVDSDGMFSANQENQ